MHIGYASRLDYWLISEHLFDAETQASIEPCPLSCHSIIALQAGEKAAPRGPGLWRMDNSLLLREDYKELIREVIEQAAAEKALSSPKSTWEWIKFKIKSATIQYNHQLEQTDWA